MLSVESVAVHLKSECIKVLLYWCGSAPESGPVVLVLSQSQCTWRMYKGPVVLVLS